MPVPAVEKLNLYLGTTGTDMVPGQGPGASLPLFTTRTGRAWNRSEAFRAVQRLAGKAGIDGRISPHRLRHTFATIALDKGVALHDLQDGLGQADPRTTRHYDRSRHMDESRASDAGAAPRNLVALRPLIGK